ncbi:carbon monoxide dehydrogenase subunit G [Phycicoccus sp. CSK15P-2]|uniref:SRPBCC family protein n=1 Tax=Phycicoccus sp. CSK15P-2 TaxID=2807627 RepID=UPI00194DC4F5|nr:carbon monoxide dehydrogenase subunit G [Phycicoccus sp. CSK15P-2]MBM6402852.1 carbon monoxide dehydrogenase subunit G [Phycicoccus sp. CSK15P-2]
MKITGTSTLDASPDEVWQAVLDPAVLARCIPGCESLRTVGEDRYAMTVTAGVAAVKGTYTGEVALTDLAKPSALTLHASGSGAPGTIDADVRVRLSPSAAGGTDLAYDADATVGGTIGGVGQRMLAGVTKKMAGQFFDNLDADIAGPGPAAAADGSPTVPARRPGAADGTAAGDVAADPPQVYRGNRRATATANASIHLDSGAGFAAGVLLGGLVTLAGVALGRKLGGR